MRDPEVYHAYRLKVGDGHRLERALHYLREGGAGLVAKISWQKLRYAVKHHLGI